MSLSSVSVIGNALRLRRIELVAGRARRRRGPLFGELRKGGRAPSEVHHSGVITAMPPATCMAPARSSTPRTTCPRVVTVHRVDVDSRLRH